MMTALCRFIETEGLTQAAAPSASKSRNPHSDLTRGKMSRFSLDTLVNMLTDGRPRGRRSH